jgi:calcineurin-like phosphoesterase family protein
MRNIFIISDTHFGHKNILKFTDSTSGLHIRPQFSSIEEMDDHIVDRWNSVVNDEDIVYHLGDVYFEDGHKALPRLKGRKRLILGNHDNGKSSYIQSNFQKVLMWRMFPEFDMLLSHVPVHPSTLGFKANYNIHGHTHVNDVNDPRYFNVCVEKMDYTPISIEDLKIRLK